MRRPLFAAALFLVIIASIRLGTGWAEEVPYGCISTNQLDIGGELLITGQVYQKNETSVYLKSVVLVTSNAFGQSAAGLRQEIPIQESNISNGIYENIICETQEAQKIPLGSYVAARGEFSAYSHATNPGEFDAAVYYRTMEVGGKLRKAVILSRGEEYWHVREWLYGLKCYFKERLYRIFPEKEAAVMSALLLGDKSELDGDLKELYKRNGVLHILSISSLHITIIGMSIYRLLRKTGLPVAPCALAGSVILILYGCMTGFSVSACRAIGMYLIKMAAEVVGRTYDMLTALGVMGAVMVLRNPFYLQNSGFLLSFTSVLGIGVVYPVLEPPLPAGNGAAGGGLKGKAAGALKGKAERENASKGKVERENASKGKAERENASKGKEERENASEGNAGKIGSKSREALAAAAGSGQNLMKSLIQSFFASLSITLTTLPVQLWFYYEIPVYSVFLNLFVIPFLKPMMITGLLAMLVPGLGGLGIVGRAILGSYELICGCFDKLPFHTWNPGCPKVWQIVVYYLLLCGAIGIRITIKRLEESKQGKMSGEGTKNNAKSVGIKGAEAIGRACTKGSRPGEEADSPGLKRPCMEKGGLKMAGAAGSTAVLILAVLLFAIHPPAENSVTFLDVGQGDCILLRTASGEVYLFDCGSSSRKNIGKYIMIPFLKYNGIHTIDAVFLSHPDADHINGAVELLGIGGENNITVNQLLLPDIEEKAKEEQLGELLKAAREATQREPVPVGYLSAGDGWTCGSAAFTCLHPVKGFSAADVNAYSECFLVEFTEGRGSVFRGGREGGKMSGETSGKTSGETGGKTSGETGSETDNGTCSLSWTLLLTGDVQEKGEEAFFREIQERNIEGITVLKAAHHGSRNSTSEEFLNRLKPLLTIISSGKNNRYGHPHAELMERLEASGTVIVQTAQSGAVTVRWQDGGLEVFGMRE
ncbi:MAG TPA: hypothetical protein DCZ91_09855 [Lachnospiraceae bacterium]|nr:hypothetical protein [Lachnospiraceae bacterium]